MTRFHSLSITACCLLGALLHGYHQGTYLLLEFADPEQAGIKTDRILVDASLIADPAGETAAARPATTAQPLFQIETTRPSAFATEPSDFKGSLTPFVSPPVDLFTIPGAAPTTKPIDVN